MEENEILNEEVSMDDAEVSFIEDSEEGLGTDEPVGSIVQYVQQRFYKAEEARYTEEQRWIKAYRNYRGIYGPDVSFTSTEKSKVFVKVTKTKVLAAYGQIVEVLFGANKFPISINPTVLPDGVVEAVHIETDDNIKKMESGEQVDIPKLNPGETFPEFQERLAGLRNKLEPLGDKIKEGEGSTPTQVTFHPAMVAAKKMEKKIHDQLEESNARKELRTTAFECALFGTGIMKGPFAVDKEYPNWSEEGDYEPVIKTVPKCSSVSTWNFYPDPDAINMDDAEYVVERHKMSRTQLRALKKRPFFRENAIDAAVSMGESYTKEWWEQIMEDEANDSKPERYQVLEFWGNVDVALLKDQNVDVPEELDEYDQVSVNIWTCNNQVLRLVLNPFTPSYIPYYSVPYEVNPYSLFGVGIAENMDDTQTLMNGFMRMAVDNAALSGNLIIEVDETNLVRGIDLSVYPGKVFPSFAHGQTGVSGVGRTASGISMLMSAANGSIRNVVKNVDDYLLGPLGKAFFNFNMQFDFDQNIKGDLEVKAQGTESLMANEVRSQRLMQFLQVTQNPALAPFAKMDYVMREIAKSMDLDPDKVVNSMADAKLQAELFKVFREQNPEPAAPQEGVPAQPGPKGAPAGAQVQDTSGAGGGTIGTGTAPQPGEQGFSGNTGEGAA